MCGLKSTILRAVAGLQYEYTVSSFSFLPERASSSLDSGSTPTSRMLRSTATSLRISSTSLALTPSLTLRSQVVATAMSPWPSTQRSHMREASPPASSSRLPRVERVPQPVVANRVAARARPMEKRLQMCMVLSSCRDGVEEMRDLIFLKSLRIGRYRRPLLTPSVTTLGGRVNIKTLRIREHQRTRTPVFWQTRGQSPFTGSPPWQPLQRNPRPAPPHRRPRPLPTARSTNAT